MPKRLRKPGAATWSLGVNRIRKRAVVLFSVAAEDWLASKTSLSPFSELHYRQYVNLLSGRFGRR